MSYPPPSQPGPCDIARFAFFLLIIVALLMMLIPAIADAGPLSVDRGPHEIVLPLSQSTDTLAVQALIEKFDSPDYIIRTDDEGYMMTAMPAFAAYAEACAKLDGCVPILVEMLDDNHRSAPGQAPPQFCGPKVSPQARLAASIALEAVGNAEVSRLATPLLRRMLMSADSRENIMALAIIRGCGAECRSLLGPLRTLLYAPDLHVQYWACRAIAAMGDAGEPAVADLCLLLMRGDQSASVRRNACIALGEIAYASKDRDVVIRTLAEVLVTDYSHPVRVEAEEALKKLFVVRAVQPDQINPNPPFDP